jgi:hypothetical protein
MLDGSGCRQRCVKSLRFARTQQSSNATCNVVEKRDNSAQSQAFGSKRGREPSFKMTGFAASSFNLQN